MGFLGVPGCVLMVHHVALYQALALQKDTWLATFCFQVGTCVEA